MPDYQPRVVRFSVFEVDLRAGELRRNGIKVKLQNQPFQILAVLLERPGEIITRDEMQARLWSAETFVDFDHGLNSAIRRLRYALGDSAENPTFVETLGGRGYRFVFPVEGHTVDNGKGNINPGLAVVVPISTPAPSAPASPATSSVPRRWKPKAAMALAALAAMALLVGLFAKNDLLSRTRLKMLARRMLLGHSATPQPAVIERRLTANPEDTPVTSAVISPDGRYLAFTDRTGFYLRQVDGGETHAIKLPEDFRPLAESWFPDSDHLVVSRVGDATQPPSLWKISVMGGTPRRLAEEGSLARVSPDGSKIAFFRNGISRNEIWLMQADGGGAHRFVGDIAARNQFFSPVAWSPNGKRAAYIRTTVTLYNAAEHRAERKIEIADASSGQFEVVLSNQQLENALGWVDNNSLLYSLREPAPNQNDFGLWRIVLDLRTAQPLGPGVRVMSGRGAVAELNLTRDGKSVALKTVEQQSDVYISDLEAGGKQLATPKRLTMDDRGDFVFSWTLDSKAVVFLSDRDGPLHLFKQAIDQPQPELLVGGDNALAIPRLNPSGTDLLYLVMPKAGESSQNVRIMRMPIAGGPPQFVLEAPGIWNHQCARLPATLCIFSPSEPNQQKFYAFDPVTGSNAEIVSARIDKDTEFPNWTLSPDGKYLATRILKPNRDAAIRILWIADGSVRTVPVQGWSSLIGIDWAADGKNVWSAGVDQNRSPFGRSQTCSVLGIDLDGKTRTMVSLSNVCFLAAIPSPDGRHLALEGEKDPSSNVWLLENF